MSAQTIIPVTRSRPTAVLRLVLLLAGAIAGAGAVTAYLLHTSATAVGPVVRPVMPVPYRLFFLKGSNIVSLDSSGTVATLALPTTLGATVREALPSPDGRRIVLISGTPENQSAWLWSGPGTTPARITEPERVAAPVHTYPAVVWTSASTVHLVVQHGARLWSVDLRSNGDSEHEQTTTVDAPVSRFLSLSPNGREVALLALQQGNATFGAQAAVRLQHLMSQRFSIALRYLGTAAPQRVLWSPDNGTVAIFLTDGGLALQKSSGRPVLAAANGRLPAVFSGQNAEFAYTSGTAHNWRLHVVSLHNEVDRAVGPPLGSEPRDLFWTPDDRVLVYTTADGVWQLDPSTGTVLKVASTLPGTAAGIAKAVPND